MCLVDQEADSQEDQADHELDDQLLPYKLKPAVKADIDHSQGHQDQANWGDQADVALPPVIALITLARSTPTILARGAMIGMDRTARPDDDWMKKPRTM